MNKRIDKLASGNSYTLYDFIGESRIIVIPDLQRDYCWAETIVAREDNPSLVQCYVDDLIKSSISPSTEMKMGLLYGYEYPRNSVQLCDGQQRLTTLFLVCGACCQILKLSANKFNSFLIKQAESILSVNGASRLQYGVRDSTLSFLNNLVESGSFCSNVNNLEWFSGEYAKDPSVRNIVLALNQIVAKVNNSTTAKLLLTFILHKITFLYFDMQSREYSEEQYVILNTTGKLLTPTEHIKPKLLGLLADDINLLEKYSEKWEGWEQFIWDHRLPDDNFTVDEWFDRLLKIFYLTENASEGSNAEKEGKDYIPYQRILQGKIKYDFPLYSKESVLSTLDRIDQFFYVANFVYQNKIALSTGFSNSDGKIPMTDIWKYLADDNWATLSNLQQSVAVFCVLNKALLNKVEKTMLLSLCSRVLDFAWVQAQYKSENQDVAKFLAFIDSIDINGMSIYKAAQSNDIFSVSLKDFKFKLLSNIKNCDEIGELELALMKIAHLQTSKAQISYVSKVLDEITPKNLNLLCHNLIKTTENISPLLRKALLTYGEYYISNGSCHWGARYDFAYSTNFFFDQLHKPDAPRKNVIESFIKDIALKEDIESYLTGRIRNYQPVCGDNDNLNNVIEIIFNDPRYFDKMTYGRLAINGSRAVAMSGSSKTYGDIRILDEQRGSILYDTYKDISAYNDRWELEYGFTLRKWYEIKESNNDSIWFRVSGDYHYNDNHQLEFRPYINMAWNENNWIKIKDILVELYPEKIYVDEDGQYILLPIVRQPSADKVAYILNEYYSRLAALHLGRE